MANGDGCLQKGIETVIEEVARDLASGGKPHLVVAGDVGERVLECLQAIRLADGASMEDIYADEVALTQRTYAAEEVAT